MYKSSAVAEMGDRGHSRHGPKRGGGAAVPFRGSWDPVWYNVAWAEVYFRTKWRLHPSSYLATIDMGQKFGGVGVPFFPGVAGSPLNTKSPGPRPTSTPSAILVHPVDGHSEHWPKIGGLCPFRGGEQGPRLTQCRVGRDLPQYQIAS